MKISISEKLCELGKKSMRNFGPHRFQKSKLDEKSTLIAGCHPLAANCSLLAAGLACEAKYKRLLKLPFIEQSPNTLAIEV
jgi:hypothetical protein